MYLVCFTNYPVKIESHQIELHSFTLCNNIAKNKCNEKSLNQYVAEYLMIYAAYTATRDCTKHQHNFLSKIARFLADFMKQCSQQQMQMMQQLQKQREVRRLTKVHGLKNKSTNAKRDGSQSESERVKVCLCNTYDIHISIMYMLRIYA